MFKGTIRVLNIGEGSKGGGGKLSLAQNSIRHIRKFLDDAHVGSPKQYAFWVISHIPRKNINIMLMIKTFFCQFEQESRKVMTYYVAFKFDVYGPTLHRALDIKLSPLATLITFELE